MFIATQLNWTQLTQLNSVQPSQSCFCLWRHDLQIESTGSLRSLIGDSCSRCERVDNSTSSWVELCRYKHPFIRHFLLLANTQRFLYSTYILNGIVCYFTQTFHYPTFLLLDVSTAVQCLYLLGEIHRCLPHTRRVTVRCYFVFSLVRISLQVHFHGH